MSKLHDGKYLIFFISGALGHFFCSSFLLFPGCDQYTKYQWKHVIPRWLLTQLEDEAE